MGQQFDQYTTSLGAEGKRQQSSTFSGPFAAKRMKIDDSTDPNDTITMTSQNSGGPASIFGSTSANVLPINYISGGAPPPSDNDLSSTQSIKREKFQSL